MGLMPTNILPTQVYPFGPTGGKTGLRYLFMMLCAMQEGVAPFGGAGGDYKVTQRAAGGAGQAVDVAAGDALILGDDTARQGIYHQCNDAVFSVDPLPAASAAQPRFDQLVLHVYDSSITGGSDTPAFEILQGTAQAGVTIDNRLGAAALPNNAIRLAEWVTPASAGAYTILSTGIRDRRPWARGAYIEKQQTAGADYTVAAGGGMVAIDTVNLQARVEIGANPLRVVLSGWGRQATNAGENFYGLMIDGVAVSLSGFLASVANHEHPLPAVLTPARPSVGSHLIGLAWRSTGGTAVLYRSVELTFAIEELARQSVENAGA